MQTECFLYSSSKAGLNAVWLTDYCVPGNAVGRSHCQNNFGNAVPRRSRWKRPLEMCLYSLSVGSAGRISRHSRNALKIYRTQIIKLVWFNVKHYFNTNVYTLYSKYRENCVSDAMFYLLLILCDKNYRYATELWRNSLTYVISGNQYVMFDEASGAIHYI